MTLLDGLGALFGVGAAWLAPGAALVIALDLGRSPLERWGLSLALGRIALALAGLVLPSTAGAGALAAVGPLALVALALAVRRARRAGPLPSWRPEPAERPALAVAVAASALLVVAVVARGGAADASGALVFYGRDSTHDPLLYLAVARALAEQGFPIVIPFAGGAPSAASYLPFGLLAGLHGAGGASWLDLAFRIVPLVETVGVAATGACLVRALGGGARAAALAAFLLPLGSEASFLVDGAGALLGRAARPLDSWALFGPYLLAFNSIAPALQAGFAALVLLVRAPAGGPRLAVVAGLLVASLFETKLFAWAPVTAALVAAAALRPPAAAARAARVAAAVAVAASLPSLVEKAWWAWTLRGSSDMGFAVCPGCLPRYLAGAALGDGDLSFRLFREFRLADLAAPAVLGEALAASALVLAVAIGARFVALPTLLRVARSPAAQADAEAAGRALAARVAGGAAALGLVASLALVVPPHYLNGAQFAWVATFGLWPWSALAVDGASAGRRRALAALLLLASLPATATVVLGRLGFAAPVSQRVGAAERALVEALAAASEPGELVLEPSMLVDPDRPSPVPWLAGRPVYLSLLSVSQNLSRAELDARFDRLVTVFVEGPREGALAAVRESGARLVLVPTGIRLPFAPGAEWEVVARNAAGVVYRTAPRRAGAGTGASRAVE